MPELSSPNDVSGLRWSRRSVLLAGGLLLTGCGGPEKPVIQSADYEGSASGLSRIRPILERRAKALADEDEEAYLADLDPSNKDLIEREKLVFANLRQFEFAEIRYVLNGMHERPDKGGSWFSPVVRIAKLTADAGPGDIAPGESFLYWLTRTGDRNVIGDIVRTTMQNREELGITGPRADAPWNTDKLRVLKVGEAVWLVGDESVTDLDEFGAVTNQELATVKKLWGGRESFPGNVLFFSRKKESVLRWFGISGTDNVVRQALGFQIPQLGVRKDGQTYTGKYAASRILVNLASIEAGKNEPWATIRHELTHAVTARASLAGYSDTAQPARWVVEGFARYSETIDQPSRAALIRGNVADGVRAGKFRGTTPFSDAFYGKDAGFNYALGSTVFSLAERLKGRDAAAELYARLVQRVDSADRSILELPVFEGISADVLGMSSDSFRSRWKSYVQNGG
ncbi:hypothetical protein RB614_27375 [Phytohabitans sp. ZYX-F-186]|uniref:Lipoprotein n=1 Tax=Phytohabitans maris TaxID=3071409 RepID=A0ABU0ZMI8_9ACTN|nr:hypothetical protein [Phytohabitans sp. ZYX-F-186]MDQ7908253.1 hypothetical protein [Phytohabitans sp. ZYX-F-186]